MSSAHRSDNVIAPSVHAAILSSLPDEWIASAKTYHYNEQTLYSYINGAADFFIRHGFKELNGIECRPSRSSSHFLNIDVYEMQHSDNARSLLSQKCAGAYVPVHGYDAACSGNGFVQGVVKNFFVEIQTSDQTSEVIKNILGNIAEQIATHLKGHR
ncbi:MAG: hypothetical protein N3B18_09000 [Desulfobacterota bacterium]|nr:hypothetical protein [Thermodesulfobacteriota bacterium]